jgi:hypothetical protein
MSHIESMSKENKKSILNLKKKLNLKMKKQIKVNTSVAEPIIAPQDDWKVVGTLIRLKDGSLKMLFEDNGVRILSNVVNLSMVDNTILKYL